MRMVRRSLYHKCPSARHQLFSPAISMEDDNLLAIVYTDALPRYFVPVMCLLRARVRASREIADDIVRARGYIIVYKDRVGAKTPCIDERKHGVTIWWHRNGTTLKAKLPYFKGKMHGMRVWWHPNGVLAAEFPFYKDVRHGLHRVWEADGSLSKETLCEDGRVIFMHTYPDGNRVS